MPNVNAPVDASSSASPADAPMQPASANH